MDPKTEKVYELIQAESRKADLEREIANLKADIIITLSPVKPGDTVPVQFCGYEKRDKGKPMRVTKVTAHVVQDQEFVHVRAVGDILRKDGTPGYYTGTAYYRINY